MVVPQTGAIWLGKEDLIAGLAGAAMEKRWYALLDSATELVCPGHHGRTALSRTLSQSRGSLTLRKVYRTPVVLELRRISVSMSILLSSHFWPIPSKSRRVVNSVNLFLSHALSRIEWIDQWAVDPHPVLTSTTSAKIGKTAIQYDIVSEMNPSTRHDRESRICHHDTVLVLNTSQHVLYEAHGSCGCSNDADVDIRSCSLPSNRHLVWAPLVCPRWLSTLREARLSVLMREARPFVLLTVLQGRTHNERSELTRKLPRQQGPLSLARSTAFPTFPDKKASHGPSA